MKAQRLEARDFVEARLYESEDAAVQDGLRHLLADRPDLRIALAVHFYQQDDGWTVGAAAQFAGVTLWDMLRILEDHGVEPRIGPATVEEARAELATLDRWLDARPG